MATVTNITYSADGAIVATNWDSLAADDVASLPEFDNTSTLYVDMLVGGQVNVDTATGVLAAGESFDIYVVAKHDKDTATSGTGGIDTAFNPNDTTLAQDVELNLLNMTLLVSVRVEATTPDTEQGYNWGPIAVAQAFGGVLPQKWFLVGHNNTGGTTKAATSTNLVNTVGITFTHT